MRRFLLSALVGIALASMSVPIAAADTGGPDGSDDLGLDGMTITRVAALKSGNVLVTGSIQCSEDIEWVDVVVEMRQDVGRFHSVMGYSWDGVSCNADVGSATFSVVIEPEQGRFGPNRARVQGDAWAEECWYDENIEDDVCVWDEAWVEPMMMKVRRGR